MSTQRSIVCDCHQEWATMKSYKQHSNWKGCAYQYVDTEPAEAGAGADSAPDPDAAEWQQADDGGECLPLSFSPQKKHNNPPRVGSVL
jgi:hypothetical protein